MRKIHWIILIISIIAAWLAFMVAASYFSYEYKSPVRLENWKARPGR